LENPPNSEFFLRNYIRGSAIFQWSKAGFERYGMFLNAALAVFLLTGKRRLLCAASLSSRSLHAKVLEVHAIAV
jgi:hypothetical protein